MWFTSNDLANEIIQISGIITSAYKYELVSAIHSTVLDERWLIIQFIGSHCQPNRW